MSRTVFVALAMWSSLYVGTPLAQIVLTIDQVIVRAREQSAAVIIAQARIAEAEGAAVGASARFADNPVVQTSAGPRAAGRERSSDVDFELAISQQFETGGQRGARLDAARAGVDRERAEVEQTARTAVFSAASAFLDGMAAIERLRIAEDTHTVSRTLLSATERRYDAGDIAALELNLARIDAARSAAAVRAAQADLTAAVGVLRTILLLPAGEPVELQGTLDIQPIPPLDRLEAITAERPEFHVLAADLKEADAQTRLGRALTRPDVGFRVGYIREETDTVVLGGFTVALPLFQRGQGTLATGLARTRRAQLELDTARATALSELRAAMSVHAVRAELANALVADTLPSVADNEDLGQRSYEAGEMSLMDLLLVRRNALETRIAVVNARLDAARSRLTVDFAAGVLR